MVPTHHLWLKIHNSQQSPEFSHDYFNAFFWAVNIKIFSSQCSPSLSLFGYLFCFCFILSGVFVSLLLGALNPRTVCLLTNPALLLSPPPRKPCLQRHTQFAGPRPAPHPSLLSQSYHCVLGKLQSNEFLADDVVALSSRSEPTPVMPGIWESAFHRLLWHFRVYIPLLPAFGEGKEGQRAALLTTNAFILLREAVRKLTFNSWIRKPELMKKHTFLRELTFL